MRGVAIAFQGHVAYHQTGGRKNTDCSQNRISCPDELAVYSTRVNAGEMIVEHKHSKSSWNH